MTDDRPFTDREDARELARLFRRFLEWVHTDEGVRDHPASRLLRDHLGDALDRSVVSTQLPTFEHANTQRALDAWLREDGAHARAARGRAAAALRRPDAAPARAR